VRSSAWPRILSEHLVPLEEPLAALVRPAAAAPAPAVARRAARALLDLPQVAPRAWPAWLAPHQVPAAERLPAVIARHGGAVLADAVGLGKSYVALAVARASGAPVTLVAPAVLVPQWRALLARLEIAARIVTHESLSRGRIPTFQLSNRPPCFLLVDEAHRFRNPAARRSRTLARLAVGATLLLVTATPVHNRLADLLHLLRLFLRDHALVALGVASLRRAAETEPDPTLLASVAARLVVARSRAAVERRYASGPVALTFPRRAPGRTVRAGTAPGPQLAELARGIAALAGGPGAALLRLTLLRRLDSSIAALRATLARHEALLRLARDAARDGRVLTARDFGRLFPARDEPDLQLALFPLLLAPDRRVNRLVDAGGDPDAVAALRLRAAPGVDPKAEALARLLAARRGKSIVFTDAAATARYLARRLARRLRVAAVFGRGGWLGRAAASRAEVLRAFAPRAQGAPRPQAALETDVLIATDLLSEGLNLQDAGRVIHYDLPWSPARLAQRVGRIDRLGSLHRRVETVSFLPAKPLARALRLEARLAAKAAAQARAGAAAVEGPAGGIAAAGRLDWCDRLQGLVAGEAAEPGAHATIAGDDEAVALVVRIGGHTEALVARGDAVTSDPAGATAILARAVDAAPRPADRDAVTRAVRAAAPLLRARVAALEGVRWRAADRDRLSRRLIPWVLAAARRAGAERDASRLAALDGLVTRLTHGMTAGEELLLEDILARRTPVAIADLLAWHERLPPLGEPDAPPVLELVAAVAVRRP
jgi:superfamily II DNA or RNA helicase